MGKLFYRLNRIFGQYKPIVFFHTNFCFRYDIKWNWRKRLLPHPFELSILLNTNTQYWCDVRIKLIWLDIYVRMMNKSIYSGNRALSEPFIGPLSGKKDKTRVDRILKSRNAPSYLDEDD